MKERGIIFRDWEVRAIQDGRKTMFRRTIKPQPPKEALGAEPVLPGSDVWQFFNRPNRQGKHNGGMLVSTVKCPFGTVGDRLYGREAWMSVDTSFRQSAKFCTCADLHGRSHTIVYRADANYSCDWRSPAAMPRWASRITLEIVNVRVERVQDISENDVTAEGIREIKKHNWRQWAVYGLEHLNQVTDTAAWSYSRMWDSIHGPGAWDRNDWVWAVTFKRLEGGAS